MKFARILLGLCVTMAAVADTHRVRFERIPGGGLQPDAIVDGTGRVHLIYLSGDPKSADIQYITRDRPTASWTSPVRVNSQSGSAIAIGTVRGARLALSRSNRVCVIWNGSSQATPKAVEGTPLLFTRQSGPDAAFETQRNLMGELRHLDGGAALATDGRGAVCVVWHAAPPANGSDSDGETARGVYLAASADDGDTFESTRQIDIPNRGVCACCALEARFGADGRFRVLYRSAEGLTERGLVELSSADGGKTFTSRRVDQWSLNQCPMTTTRFTADGRTAVWSTRGQIQLGHFPSEGFTGAKAVSESGRSGNHPAIAAAPDGRMLVVWTEGTGWQRGGELAWQEFSPDGTPDGPVQRQPGVPVWGSPAAVAERDGAFSVWY